MSRYIDIDKYKKFECCTFPGDCQLIKQDFSCIDCYYHYDGKVDVAPVLHAEWIYSYIMGRPFSIMCSNCHIKTNNLKDMPYNYCPWCGAKMDKE